MRFVVATHGHCFDGLASAAVFAKLVGALDSRSYQFEFRACGYGHGQARADARLLDGDDNGLLDYGFANAPKLRWFFDHHRTAFRHDVDLAAYEKGSQRGRLC